MQSEGVEYGLGYPLSNGCDSADGWDGARLLIYAFRATCHADTLLKSLISRRSYADIRMETVHPGDESHKTLHFVEK